MKKWNLAIINFLIDDFFISHYFPFSCNHDAFFERRKSQKHEISQFSKTLSKYMILKLKTHIPAEVYQQNFSKQGIIKLLLHTEHRIKLKGYEVEKNPNNRQRFMRFVNSTPSDLYFFFLNKMTRSGRQALHG